MQGRTSLVRDDTKAVGTGTVWQNSNPMIGGMRFAHHFGWDYRKRVTVRECAMFQVHTILHPTDFSTYSQHAFRLACALARDYGARVVVMHAVPFGTTEFLALSELGSQEKAGSIRQSFWGHLHRIESPDPNVHVEYRLEHGDPTSQVLRVAKELHADLIVMGTHGRTGLSRVLMGSVAEQVVRNATCPVLTVKTPSPETALEPTANTGVAGRS